MKKKQLAKTNNCRHIRNLEKRLLCLKEKYEELTKRLEEEQKSSTGDDSIIDYQSLYNERKIIEKYLTRLEKHLSNTEKTIKSVNSKDKVNTGAIVNLKNNNAKLTFRLVETIYSSEENQISINSPIGKAILGKRVGDKVKILTPKGQIIYKIESVK